MALFVDDKTIICFDFLPPGAACFAATTYATYIFNKDFKTNPKSATCTMTSISTNTQAGVDFYITFPIVKLSQNVQIQLHIRLCD